MATWRAVAPRLADAGWRVACPDLKGFGRTEGPRDGYDSRTLADEVSQLIPTSTPVRLRSSATTGAARSRWPPPTATPGASAPSCSRTRPTAASISAGRAWLGYYRALPRRAAVSAATRTVRRVLPFTDPGSPPRLRVPAAVVWGEGDPVLPRSVAERVAGDLDAELTLIPDVGHFPHEEDPDAFARAVLDHIGVVGEHVALEHR